MSGWRDESATAMQRPEVQPVATCWRSCSSTLHGKPRTSAYKLGEQVGRIGALVVVLLIGLRFLLRSRKKRAP
ncbi:MAG: hypothetical protein ABIY55_00410 [Kofleriaceae bacterium]